MFGSLLTMAEAGTEMIGSVGLALAGIGIGVALVVVGAAKGIGNIGGHAMDSIARQPEAGGPIGTNMIISAALIEGFTYFALIIAIMLNGNVGAFIEYLSKVAGV